MTTLAGLNSARYLLEQIKSGDEFRRFTIETGLFPRRGSAFREINVGIDLIERWFGDTRRENGQLATSHLYRATALLIEYSLRYGRARLCNRTTVLVTLFHDSIEDIQECTTELLAILFGDDVAWRVDLVSKDPEYLYTSREERDFYYWYTMWRYGSRDPSILAPKVADRTDNHIDEWGCAPWRLKRKNAETRRWVLPMAAETILYHELLSAVREGEQLLKDTLNVA